jgi:hypothetical protein
MTRASAGSYARLMAGPCSVIRSMVRMSRPPRPVEATSKDLQSVSHWSRVTARYRRNDDVKHMLHAKSTRNRKHGSLCWQDCSAAIILNWCEHDSPSGKLSTRAKNSGHTSGTACASV